MFFLAPKDISVAIDISSHSIKLVKLKRGRRMKILKKGEVLLPPDLVRGSFVNENIRDKKVFVEKVRELFSSVGLSDKEIAVGIPDTVARSIFLELENIPKNREDAKEFIMWKLKKDMDLNLDKNFVVDYQILNQILVVLINKKILAEYEESLREIGLKPVLTTLSSFGLVNFFNFNERNMRDFVIVNRGHLGTTLLIVRNQKLDFIRSIDNFDLEREMSASLRHYQDKTAGFTAEKVFQSDGMSTYDSAIGLLI